MATSNHSGSMQIRSQQSSVRQLRGGHGRASYQPSRPLLVRIGVVLLLAALVGLAWFGPSLRRSAVTATAYGARMACSCHYVGGRSLADCRKDFESGMGLISLWEDGASHSITARLPLLASQTARFQPGPGCVLERWR